jgi:hypothetical protein
MGVYNTIEDYKRGDPNWTKVMGKTATKFAFTALLGEVTEYALGFVVAATPVGWIAIIAIAAATALVAIAGDSAVDSGWNWLAKHNIGV